MREWWASSELVGLAGMPTTVQGIKFQANRQAWRNRPRAGRGGGLEYHLSSLPTLTQNALIHQEAARLLPAPSDHPEVTLARVAAHQNGESTELVAVPPDPAAVPGNHSPATGNLVAAHPRAPAPRAPRALAQAQEARERAEWRRNATLTDWQRRCRDARLLVLTYLDDLTAGLGGQGAAVRRLIDQLAAGELPAPVAAALAEANERPRHDGLISTGTLYRWLAARRQGPDALAPSPGPLKITQPAWVAPLLALYQDPAKPTVAACLRQLRAAAPAGLELPSQRTAEVWLTHKLPAAITQWGRLGTRARRSIKPFVRRTTDGLWPMDIVAVDGHTFKAWVAHPLSGERFRPELTTYLDLASRRIVGCAAWVAESQHAIWLALRAMVVNPHQGIPALQYSDNGAYKGETHRALLDRLGVAQCHSLPGNPQANGAIERINRSLWLPAAKQLPLYAGKDMDKDAFKARKAQADKTGAGILPWADFTAFLQAQIRAYNGRPHASLRRGRETLSPDQAWQEALAEGWQPTLLDGDDLHDLLPTEARTCQRGEVRLPWGRYYSKDLDDYHGQRVRVAYDPFDNATVWVSDGFGRLIATAKRDGNARPYVSTTAIEDARAKREAARVQRLEKRIARVKAEETPLLDLTAAGQGEYAPELAAMIARLPDLRLPGPGEYVPDLTRPAAVLPVLDRPAPTPLAWETVAASGPVASPAPTPRDAAATRLPPSPPAGEGPGERGAVSPGNPPAPLYDIRMDAPTVPADQLAPVVTLPGLRVVHYLDRQETDPERYQHWCRLKADADLGKPLDARESAFVQAFGQSDYARITERLYADFEARMGARPTPAATAGTDHP